MWEFMFYSIIDDIDNFKPNSHDDVYNIFIKTKLNIENLQAALTEDEDDSSSNASHLITFALTAYCDEKLGLISLEKNYIYTPIQLSLFGISNAGSEFYDYIDVLISKDMPSIKTVFIYYFLLKNGFRGCYEPNESHKKTIYMKKLKVILKAYISNQSPIKKINGGTRKTPYPLFGSHIIIPALFFSLSFLIIQYIRF
ncbi:DotU family type IV/VI secretion system protein [Francisella adeliensis]|uniref:DotU family type IV/VI secretion system protein n=1 Tax=Francisella adeliensis TaxID=2007306 RepID=A0A2Z4Y228_9GAMM|nr:DotU family type IV/VI secretion system protein [Francisella adeliensis]AXA34575.1 hypothetical protein CDH04_09285 [Francisella adeliensis]MBK2086299.1 DotU family type IV/VI secretion system protein [Francisella adeliensis]MBK2096515.1 DotU family type IV/VI secretion system protein [Francisella adeliensis]QIW12820.1 DotU family type IV/VI secretion system protein [Francisella adeliensis]QIW14697.1 DotU family type IV/VI secretion system protein [Francisella adeliensis]